MGTEQVKTLSLVAVAAVLSLLAFSFQPRTVEVENQAKVNEPLFPTYESSEVWSIEIEKPVSTIASTSSASVEKITVRRTSRGWEIPEYDNYPAGNSQLIGLISGILDQLNVLEVVSESATDEELAEYGVMKPGESVGTPDKEGVRLKLSDAGQTEIGELIVGIEAAGTDGAKKSYYVRLASEQAIYRVALAKQGLSTRLLDWVNPNLLGIKPPPGINVSGSPIRELQRMVVSTPSTGRAGSDSYRADFSMGAQVILKKLETFQEGQWQVTPVQRVPASADFSQTWVAALQTMPAVVLISDVEAKTAGLARDLKAGLIHPGMDLSEFEALGISIVETPEENYLMGEAGRAKVEVNGGLQFQMVFGRSNERELTPVVIYATQNTDKMPSRPKLKELPAESSDWGEDKKQKEQLSLAREFNKATEDWDKMSQGVVQEVELINSQLSPWIYYVPTAFVVQTIPDIRLTEVKATPAPTTPAPTTPAPTTPAPIATQNPESATPPPSSESSTADKVDAVDGKDANQ